MSHKHPPKTAVGPSTTSTTEPKGSASDERFVREYDANGGNGTRAYLAAHPTVRRTTAAAEAYRLLRKPEIQTRLAALRAARWKRLEMDADEATALVGLRARANIRDAYDAEGKLLPIEQWPESLQLAVRAIKPGPFGDTLTLYDALKACEIVLTMTGKLTVKHQHDKHQHEHSLLEILAGVAAIEQERGRG